MAGVGLTTSLVFAQTQTVRGVVVEAGTGEPIIGANIIVKGHSTVGVTTNLDGKFSLNVPKGAKQLVVSYIGYKKAEVDISANMKISLESETSSLDEVMVVAFGTAKKSSFTGSATVVDAKSLSKMQVSNVSKALEGKVPGVYITSDNNQPGTSSTVAIRGRGSFTAKSDPLYVVDGVPFDGDISSINPADIESTTILKDASSSALYGARGANGVIMITTKSGKGLAGKLSVNFESRFGLNQRGIKDYDFMTDPKEYAAKYFEAIYYNQLIDQKKTPEEAMKLSQDIYFSDSENVSSLKYHPFSGVDRAQWFMQDEQGHFYMNPALSVGAIHKTKNGKEYYLQPDNWANEVFTTNPRQEYNLSISGRSEKANFFLSAGYLNDQGYTVGSGFERLSTRLKGDYELTKWLKLGANIGYTHYVSKRLRNTDSSGDSGNIFGITSNIAPIYPMYIRDKSGNIITDTYGNQLYDFGNGSEHEYPELNRPFLAFSNPMATNKLDDGNNRANIVSIRGYADFNLATGLKLTLNMGYDNDDTYHLTKRNSLYGQTAKSGGYIYREFNRTSSINLQQLLTYSRTFGKHKVDALLGHEFYKKSYNELWGEKSGYYRIDETELSGTIRNPSVSSEKSFYATEGYLGRVQYDYASKYFLEASYRRDASSRFHQKHRWGNFWSVGASWLINKESFMSGVKFVDLLKLKLSYGEQGNDNIRDFLYLDRYTLKNSNDKFSIGFSAKGKEDLTWETSGNFNVGVEFSLLSERLRGSIECYTREVRDMLFWHTAPKSGGYNGYYNNIGRMSNTGIELELFATPVKNKTLTWTLGFNAAYSQNRLNQLPADWEAVEGGYRSGYEVYRVGGSIFERAMPKYLGVDKDGLSLWQTYDKEKGTYGTTIDYTVASEKDNREIYTDLRPMWTGGLSCAVEAFGFELSSSFSWALGGRMYDGSYASLMHAGNSSDTGHNFHRDQLNSWTPKNSSSNIPRVNYTGKHVNSISDRFFVSRNFLALNNITLSYNIPSSFIKRWGIEGARLYLVGDNLGLLSARQGFDPRFGGGVGYKAMRTYSFGVKLNF